VNRPPSTGAGVWRSLMVPVPSTSLLIAWARKLAKEQ
jgi:hypothetical protein